MVRMRRGNGESKEETRRGGGGTGFGTYLRTGCCESEARAGEDWFPLYRACGSWAGGTPLLDRKQLLLRSLRLVRVPFG